MTSSTCSIAPPVASRSGLGAQFGHPRGLVGAIVGRVMALVNARANRWLVDQLSIAPWDRVLEVGFGPGVGLEAASKKASEGVVIGVDPSSEMLHQAERRNERAIALGRIELHRGTGLALPLEDASVDKVFSFNVIQFFDLEAGLRELHRVLRPSGVAAVAIQPRDASDATASVRAWSLWIDQAMRAAGFASVAEAAGAPGRPAACLIAHKGA